LVLHLAFYSAPYGHNIKGKGKGKAVPLQAWSGPEGSRELRFPDFMTTAQNVGKGKGKAVPLKAWSGPEGSRSFRFPDFMTFGT
jgi:hypothetical protein